MKTLNHTVQILGETEKAIKISSIQITDYNSQKTYNSMWLPKSKIEIKSRFDIVNKNDGAVLVIPAWILKDKPFEMEYSGDCNSIWISIFADHYEPEIG